MKKIFAIVIAASVLAVIRWFFSSTAGFNRGLDLVQMVTAIIYITPLFVVVVISLIVFAKTGFNSEKNLPKAPVIVLSVIMAVISLTITFAPTVAPGPVRTSVWADSLRQTDDGLFEYRFELLNAFQRNASARLFVRDLATNEEMYIPINIPNISYAGPSTRRNISFLWARMMASEVSGEYILTMPAGRPWSQTYINEEIFEYARMGGIGDSVFLIQMEEKTAVEIFRKMDYRSGARRIDDQDGQFLFSYYLELFDTFENGELANSEVFLNIIMPEPRRTYAVSLPLDSEFLAENVLRRRWRNMAERDRARWVVLEQTGVNGQFIAQTTSVLSRNVSMRFLVDVETLVAARVE